MRSGKMRQRAELYLKTITLCITILCIIAACGPITGGGEATSDNDWRSIQLFPNQGGWGETNKDIVHTDDGGKTWQVVTPEVLATPNTGTAVSQSFFVDSQTAWIIRSGERRYKQTNGKQEVKLAHAYHTVDGGQHWNIAEIPGTENTFSDIRSNPGSIAHSFMPHITHSDTWLNTGISNISTVGINQAWITIVATSLHVGGGREENRLEYVRLLQTVDGGKNWQKLWEQKGKDNSQVNGTFWSYLTDKGTGFMNGPQADSIQKTADGGKTWQGVKIGNEAIPSKDLPTIINTSPTFFDTQHGVISLRQYGNESYTYTPYRTSDGGQSWQKHTPITLKSTPYGNQVQPVAFIDAQHWIASDQGALHYTDDGGKTWSTRTLSDGYAYIGGLHFTSSTKGVGIAYTAVTKTLDTGQSYQGYDTTPVQTRDSGRTWQKMEVQIDQK